MKREIIFIGQYSKDVIGLLDRFFQGKNDVALYSDAIRGLEALNINTSLVIVRAGEVELVVAELIRRGLMPVLAVIITNIGDPTGFMLTRRLINIRSVALLAPFDDLNAVVETCYREMR